MKHGIHKLYFVLFIVLVALTWQSVAVAQTITLKYATMNAPTSWHHTEFYVKWAEKVGQLTEGRVKVQVYPGQTLGQAASFFDLVRTGIADIALGVNAYNPGQFPLTEMLSLPMLPIPNASAANATMWALFEKYPEMQKEYAGTKLLHFGCAAPFFMATARNPVHKMEDLRGLKIRVTGARASDAISRLGAVPVAITIPELYMAIERGMVDGVTTIWEAVSQLPVDKLKHITYVPLYAAPFWIAANQASWNKLSAKDQEIIGNELAGMAGSLMHGAVFDQAEAPAREMIKEWTYYRLPDDEVARWEAVVLPIHEEYITTLERRGLPARAFYNDMMELLRRYTQISRYPLVRE